jgi:hypothetical protein
MDSRLRGNDNVVVPTTPGRKASELTPGVNSKASPIIANDTIGKGAGGLDIFAKKA